MNTIFHLNKNDEIIIISQIGKVASSSVSVSIENINYSAPVYHIHYLSDGEKKAECFDDRGISPHCPDGRMI